MAVAKTYQSWKTQGTPFEENKKCYIIVINPKTGAQKKVRWYTDREYAKMYNEPYVSSFDPREPWGFGDERYVTIFSGDKRAIQDFFVSHPRVARYNTILQWFIPSSLPVPADWPEGVYPVTLPWSCISTNDKVRDYEEVKKIINELIGAEIHPYNPFE